MARETVGLKIDIDSKSVATATRRSDALAASSGRVGNAAAAMGRAIVAVGAAAAAAGAALLAMTQRISEQADEIGKNSRAIGLSTDSYQELSLALNLSGSSIEASASAFRRLSANALDAQQGVSTAVEAFEAIGVASTTAEGEIRSIDDMLGDIADRFAEMPDGAEKTARAMEIFGRAGARLIPLLNQGSEGIEEMRAEAHELGLVLTNETIVASEMLNDNITRLKTVAGSFARGLATQLIPRLRQVSEQVIEVVRSFMGADTAATDLASDGLELMIGALRFTAQAAVRAYQGVLLTQRAFMSLRDSLGTWNPLTGFAGGVAEANPAIDEIDAKLMRLEGLFESIGEVGRRESLTLGGMMSEMVEGMDAARRAGAVTLPEIERGLSGVGDGAEEATIAVDGFSAGIMGLDAAYSAAVSGAMKLNRAIGAQIEQAKELRAIQGENKLDGAEKLSAALQQIEERAISVQSLATTALQGVFQSFQQFSVSAIVDRDADALKNFGRSLGQMLVQLGTMAVAYAAVAALSNLFPALAPLVGPATAAPALAAAGAGAIAAGALLGAATKDKPRSTGGDGGAEPTRDGPTTLTTIYNVAFDSLTPARARSRAMVEQVSSSVGSAA